MIPLSYFIILASILFAIGMAIVIIKNNIIMILMGIELILNAANINFVAFCRHAPQFLEGQMMTLFTIILAVAEAAIALAIVLSAVNYYKTSNIDEVDTLKG